MCAYVQQGGNKTRVLPESSTAHGVSTCSERDAACTVSQAMSIEETTHVVIDCISIVMVLDLTYVDRPFIVTCHCTTLR